MKIKIHDASKEALKPYGQVIELPVQSKPTVAVDTVTFWKQQAVFSIKGATEVGVLKVKKQKMVFDDLENHFKTISGLICLDGDFALAVATPSNEVPKADALKAFKFKKNQLVILDDKCWHGVAYPIDTDEITLLVIFEKDALDNDTVFEKLDEACELYF